MYFFTFVICRVSQKGPANGALRCRRDYRKRQKNVKKFYWTYLLTHYQYLILRNREFRSFGSRKKYFKPTTVTLQGNNVRIYLCLHCITVNNNNKNN
jgi:hypothetical protein